MDYRWIKSPPNANFRSETTVFITTLLLTNRLKRSACWPKERAHGDKKLTIYFTWPKVKITISLLCMHTYALKNMDEFRLQIL